MQVCDLVYINSDGSKTRARDRYLVISDDGLWCNVRKFTGSELRSTSYRVKLVECFCVPDQSAPSSPPVRHHHRPQVPEELSLLPNQDDTSLPYPNLTPPYLRDSLVEDLPQAYPEYIPSPMCDEPTKPAIDSCQSPVISPTENTHPAPNRSSRQRSHPAILRNFVLLN